MSFLLDTNVVSEWVKPIPNRGLMNWLAEVDEDRTFLSAITIAELRYGVERMPAGKRKRKLDEWIADDLLLRFEDRVLPVDTAVADVFGRLVDRGEKSGRPIGTMDAFIAATAEVHDLTLITRDAGDFAHLLPSILNPWS